MNGIIVGAGGPTRELLRRLGDAWELTVIDPSAEVLDQAHGIRPFHSIRGDGTSRIVLERAGLAGSDALVAATNDDDVNLEVCRLGVEAGIHRIVAVAADPERVHEFRALGVAAFSGDSIAARRIEENLELRRFTSQSFAQGRAEAIEFEVASTSPVCGKSLQELKARSWVVGAILRTGELVIPHGDTVLQQGDLVTIMGAGADFAEIVKTFCSGQPRFPLDYGQHVVLLLDPRELGALGEASSLVRNSRATSLLLVHRDEQAIRDDEERTRLQERLEKAEQDAGGIEIHRRSIPTDPGRAMKQLLKEESVGILVRRLPRRGWIRGPIQAARAVGLSRRFSRPILLARGSYPYQRILVPARRTPAGRAAARAAIDLAVRGKIPLTALAVVDPLFLAGPTADLVAEQAMTWLRDEASVLNLRFDAQIRRGNPIRHFQGEIREKDLLVLGVSESRRNRFPVPIVDHLTARSPVSVLLVPTTEKDRAA